MDSHFDPNAFHPSFTSETGTHLSGNVFSMTLSHFHQMAHEYNLPDDVVQDAVHGACDFLKMDDLEIKQAGQVGVFTHNPQPLNDDVLGFNRQQMLDMGVHDGKTLSLICTHEAAHCMLQYLSSTHELSNWQEELSCDAFMGVRAAVEGIDTGKVEDTLRNMQTSTTHPNGELRLRYLEIGKQIGEDLKSHDIPVTTDNIMARLSEYVSNDAELIFKQEAIVNELASSNGGDSDSDNSDEQKGYTREEISRRKKKCEHTMACEESNMRHCKYIIESKMRQGVPYEDVEYQFKMARIRYTQAKEEKMRLEHMHPEEPKTFMGEDTTISDSDTFHTYTESDVVAAQRHADNMMDRWREAHTHTEKCKTVYGADSSQYHEAQRQEERAKADFNRAKAQYEQIARSVF